MSLTSDDLHELRKIFATKEDLAREVTSLRTETAENSADLRRHMEILIEDLKSSIHVMFDGLAARIDSARQEHIAAFGNHESRLEFRTTALEAQKPKRR